MSINLLPWSSSLMIWNNTDSDCDVSKCTLLFLKEKLWVGKQLWFLYNQAHKLSFLENYSKISLAFGFCTRCGLFLYCHNKLEMNKLFVGLRQEKKTWHNSKALNRESGFLVSQAEKLHFTSGCQLLRWHKDLNGQSLKSLLALISHNSMTMEQRILYYDPPSHQRREMQFSLC